MKSTIKNALFTLASMILQLRLHPHKPAIHFHPRRM
jgi:hypothetical protein